VGDRWDQLRRARLGVHRLRERERDRRRGSGRLLRHGIGDGEEASVVGAQVEHRGGPLDRADGVDGLAGLGQGGVDRLAGRQGAVQSGSELAGGAVGDLELHRDHRRDTPPD